MAYFNAVINNLFKNKKPGINGQNAKTIGEILGKPEHVISLTIEQVEESTNLDSRNHILPTNKTSPIKNEGLKEFIFESVSFIPVSST